MQVSNGGAQSGSGLPGDQVLCDAVVEQATEMLDPLQPMEPIEVALQVVGAQVEAAGGVFESLVDLASRRGGSPVTPQYEGRQGQERRAEDQPEDQGGQDQSLFR